MVRKTVENSTAQELNAWVKSVQASPNFRKAWPSTQVADDLRRRSIHLVQVEEAGRRGGPAGSSICAVGGGHHSARRIPKEDKDSRLDQTCRGTLRSRSTAGESSSQNHGEEAREWKRKGWNWETELVVVNTAERMAGQATKCLRISKKQARIAVQLENPCNPVVLLLFCVVYQHNPTSRGIIGSSFLRVSVLVSSFLSQLLVSQCTNEGFSVGSHSPDSCTLVHCPCWKRFCF